MNAYGFVRSGVVFAVAVATIVLTISPLAWSQTTPAAEVLATRDAAEEALKNAGFDPKRHAEDTLLIAFTESDGWKFDFSVRPAPDAKRVFIFAKLLTLPAVDQLPAKPLADVLVSNTKVNPPFFMIVDYKTSSELWFAHHVENTPENLKKIREHVNIVCRGLRLSAPLWTPAAWGLTPAAPATPSTQPAAG